MRVVAAILRSLARAARRDLGAFRSIQVNNFFLFVFLLIYGALESGVRPSSSYPFLTVLAFLLLFPLSSDPLARIPASRLAVWPLSDGQRIVLRLASLALSPVLWFAAAIAGKVRFSLLLIVLAIAVVAQAVVPPPGRPTAHAALTRRVTAFLPTLFRNHFRQMFDILDTWLAILISLGGTVWRIVARNPDPAAFPIFAILVALALSTYTQSLFALDGRGGIVRYHLLPMAGWQVLASKGAAWLALLIVLTAPLNLASGLTFGLTALAIGHYPSRTLHLPLQRFRFAGGRVLFSAAQMVVGAALAFGAATRPLLYLPAAALLYAASLMGTA